VITIQDIAYVRSGTADLETAVGFAVDIVGLELVERTADRAYLRADNRHHCLSFVAGEAGVLASAFTLADEDRLADAEAELSRAGFTVTRGDKAAAADRHVREFIAFEDPFGNVVELVVDQKEVPTPVNFARAAGITEFGHLCLDAPDVRAAHRFWTKHFNLKVSDWIGDAACLMRFDPVHHKMAVFKGAGPGLCHMNFQVESIDDVMRSWHFLQDNGIEIEQGPGRHPQSGAVFLYFKGPEGLTYEYSYGVRRIEDDDAWRVRYFDPAEPDAIDMWRGPTNRCASQPQLPGLAAR
jgi:2,3-dihydroxy-p-cumate/2,3-dihydroxybenzoate 3,4-dioxygenase